MLPVGAPDFFTDCLNTPGNTLEHPSGIRTKISPWFFNELMSNNFSKTYSNETPLKIPSAILPQISQRMLIGVPQGNS